MILAGIMLLLSLALFAKSAQNLLSFDISPNPMDSACEISVEFVDSTAITLVIMNERGQTVKTIYSGPVHKNATFKWERDDAAGNWVPSGTYLAVINYQSRYTSTKKTLILK
jgi:flagellar hook assembly protein FlgD